MTEAPTINLAHFIGRSQLATIRAALHGEEGEFFRAMLKTLTATIAGMPNAYDTDGRGDGATAILHYFTPSSDWWIVEKDAGSADDPVPGMQVQAFGFACLNGDTDNAESGYISIAELIAYGAELDLYWTPKTLGEIKRKHGIGLAPAE
jgi:hypothetical protein